MMTNQHLACYYASITNGSTNADVAAVNDSILTRLNNHYVLPEKGSITWAYAAGADLTRMRLNTPKYRFVGLPSIVPINGALAVPSPQNVVDLTAKPLMVDPTDEIAIEATTGGAAAAVSLCAVNFTFGMAPIQPSPVYRLLATAAITCAAGTWVSGALTFAQTLPGGTYQIVGMRAVGTNLLAARLVIPGSAYRPGVVACNTEAGIQWNGFTDGSLGVWGDFTNVNVPNLECLSIGACTAQAVYLDVMYKAPGSR